MLADTQSDPFLRRLIQRTRWRSSQRDYDSQMGLRRILHRYYTRRSDEITSTQEIQLPCRIERCVRCLPVRTTEITVPLTPTKLLRVQILLH